MARNRAVDAVIEELRSHGVQDIRVTYCKSGHFKLKFEHHGAKLLLTCSSTESDCRATKNAVAIARRMIRQAETGGQ